MRNNNDSFPFLGILTLIFITLKLCGVVAWSWWWVFAPMWGIFALIFGGMAITWTVVFVASLFCNLGKLFRRKS